MLVLLGLAGRKFREILKHGVRRVASQENLGDSEEARAQEGQKSAPQGKCKAWALEIARVSFEFAGVKRVSAEADRDCKALVLEIARVPLSQVGKNGEVVA